MAIKRESTYGRILRRVPLRLSMKMISLLSYVGMNPLRMRLFRRVLRAAGVKMNGKPKYISASVFFDNFDQVTLGDEVVMSSHVSLLTHDYSITTAMIAAGEKPATDHAVIRPITIGNNVFIGRYAILMPGTTIEDNVIVGAGAVVRGTVKAGSVVIGNPATVATSIETLLEKHKSRADTMTILVD